MAKRAAIYSRFSSDLQRDRSIEDQAALCRAYAAREGLAVVAEYSDRARSGASLIGRDGLLSLIEAARARAIDVVIVEALDRLSRDQEDLAGLYKRFTFQGIEIRAVHDGVATEVQVGIRGLVGALYLQDLAAKVRRGQAGVVRDARNAGGRAYGYRPVAGRPGELTIEEEEAAVVRRIFADYTERHLSPREIAGALNREGVPPPRGRFWAAVTLNGNRSRGHGILLNPLYDGRIVWNRVRMVKDPDTGRRVSRINPQTEWMEVRAEHLRIVDAGTFAAATAQRTRTLGHPATRRPRHLLSGLLRCALCGAGLSIKDRRGAKTRLVCTQAKEAGTCAAAGATWHLDRIEATVLAGLRRHLDDPAALALYVETYNDERRRLAADAIRQRARLERLLVTAQAALDRTIDHLIHGRIGNEEADRRLPQLRAERDRKAAALAAADKAPDIITLHPGAIAHYRALLEELSAQLKVRQEEGHPEPTEVLRELIESVTVGLPDSEGRYPLQLQGRLERLIGGQPFPHMKLGGLNGSGGGTHTIPPSLPPFVLRLAA